ncbi:putative coactivator CBP, KIX domain-containing protein [Medicago truncatula]|nr:mediator of RNA polymerase II transcription subunit 15a [Medicago truncatula]RHN76561.1 putative coactivator CBP, KIX domain-containing protein [Medicago truncatula]
MVTNNWRPNQGAEPNMDTSDWRGQLQPESRQRIVNKIMDTLKRHLPVSGQEGLHELWKIAQRFEEKIYTAATSQSDYLRKISLKMLTMETKSQGTIANNIPPNQVGPSNQPPYPDSLDSVAQTGQPNGGDWQEEIYQNIKAMKESYLPKLSEMIQKIATKLQQHDSLPQQPKSDELEMLKEFKMVLERLITFLQVSKSNISPCLKEKLGSCEKQIINCINTYRPNKMSSLDSTAKTGKPSGGDWQEEVYQKIKVMKESYLPELNEMYQKIATKLQQHDSLPHQPKSDQLEKLKVFKLMLERLITFLQVSKSNISPSLKEKLGSYEKQIINFINTNRPREMSSLQPGQLPPPHTHSMSQTQPQVTQRQQLHQMNDVNDMKMRQVIGVKPGVFEQHIGNALAPSSGKSTVTEELMDRLVKAVSSLTPAALSAAVSDTSSVISMIDRIAASAPGNGSIVSVGEDLVAMTNCHLQDRNFLPQDGVNGSRKMKRCINATPFDVVSSAGCVNDSIKQLNAIEASDLEPIATSIIKRPKIEF